MPDVLANRAMVMAVCCRSCRSPDIVKHKGADKHASYWRCKSCGSRFKDVPSLAKAIRVVLAESTIPADG